ncbi:hypothetical protein C5167_009049 [Papaver somniferum]|uniref:Uncharacterized protein n=1 Tax=Papaver somniferum TaxID=3469 RepID=A0A4Y7K096_PAPSO|nr:hypothetical protein C5167_009049 [Papaver somniferum]
MYTGAQVVPSVVFRLKGGTLCDNRRIMNIDVWTLILRRNLPFYILEQILPDLIKYWVFFVTLGFTAQDPCRVPELHHSNNHYGQSQGLLQHKRDGQSRSM